MDYQLLELAVLSYQRIADSPFLQKTGSRSSQIGSGSNSPDTLIRD